MSGAWNAAVPETEAASERPSLLKSAALLDPAVIHAFERLARLAARVLNAPTALVCLGNAPEHRVQASTGLSDLCRDSVVDLIQRLCESTAGNAPMAIDDVRDDSQLRELSLRACVCLPLVARNGEMLGRLSVIDSRPRHWEAADIAALADLCEGTMAEIELRADGLVQAEATSRLKLREQELAASQERFAAAFHAHPLPMTIHDFPEGRYLEVNDAWLAQTGFTREEAVGRTSAELNVYTDPAVRETLFRMLSEQGTVRGLEGSMRTKSGEVRHYLLFSRRVTIDGEPRLVSGTYDITERRRAEDALRERRQALEALHTSEEQLRLITHALPVYILHCDAEYRYKFVNTAYAARFGLRPEQLLGKRIPDIIGEEAWRSVAHKLERVLGGEFVQYEAHVPYPVIGPRYVRSVNVPERDERGVVRGFIGVLIDITEQKDIEEERARLLEQSLKQAEELRAADRSKDEFLAMLAHELRNPLAPIKNAAELLPRLIPDEPPTRQAIQIIQRQVKHMTRLVDDLLDVSRITRGKVILRKEPIDIAQVLHLGIELARPLMDEKQHDITVTVPAEAFAVLGDPARLAQVFGNLLNNAAKYTDERGRIAISAEREGQHVAIRVRDSGMGIPADLLPRVFEPFTQAERTLDRTQGGLGIGLALVKSLVILHGGSVEAHSAGQGQGSEFVVRLPVLRRAGRSKRREEIGARPPRPRRILIVDDNADAADSMAILLQLDHHDVRVQYDGNAALQAARAFDPEVLLLDIGLPGTDGYAVARQLRALAQTREAILIAVTGYGQSEDRERAKAAGFDHHLVKPVDLDALRSLLAEPGLRSEDS